MHLRSEIHFLSWLKLVRTEGRAHRTATTLTCVTARRRAELEALGSRSVIEGCVDALIRVLVDLHSIDPKAVGLSDFGKPDGYLERQVRRWGSQWELVRLPDDHRDADISRLHLALQKPSCRA